MAKTITEVQKNNFLKTIIPIAQRQARKHNGQIYASICIAQAIHESGWGTSTRMAKANAVFGIKVGQSAYHFGNAWKGASYNSITSEYYDGKTETRINDNFRAYDSLEDSTEDYFDMLCHCKRYKPALNQPTAQKCIEAIMRGGYATGPDYVKHIMAIWNQYNLGQYDDWSVGYKETSVKVTTPSTIKLNSRGNAVKIAQDCFNKKGYNLKVDGIFGIMTEAVTLHFQKSKGLTMDCIIGPKTWDKLLQEG